MIRPDFFPRAMTMLGIPGTDLLDIPADRWYEVEELARLLEEAWVHAQEWEEELTAEDMAIWTR